MEEINNDSYPFDDEKLIENRFEEFFDAIYDVECIAVWLNLPPVIFDYYKKVGEDYLFLSNEIYDTRIFIFLEAGDDSHYWSSAQSREYQGSGDYRRETILMEKNTKSIDEVVNDTFTRGLPDLEDFYLPEILDELGFLKFRLPGVGSQTKRAL